MDVLDRVHVDPAGRGVEQEHQLARRAEQNTLHGLAVAGKCDINAVSLAAVVVLKGADAVGRTPWRRHNPEMTSRVLAIRRCMLAF